MENCKRWSIAEEERESNPIYRVVFNKVRNLNKKLAQIHHIETLERKTLKPAQIAKLSKKEELLREISDLEDFASRYKGIVVENNLTYDKVDDLLKISAMLTVGKRIQTEAYCPDQTSKVYAEIYQDIFARSDYNEQNQLSDEIVRVFKTLQTYLSQPNYYTQCQDYLTYLQEIDQRNKSRKDSVDFKEQEKAEIMAHVGKINQILHHQMGEKARPKKLILMSEVVKIQSMRVDSLKQEITEIKENMRRKMSAYECDLREKSDENESTNIDSESKRGLSETEIQHCQIDILEDSSLNFSKKKEEDSLEYRNTSLRQCSSGKDSKKRRKNKKRNYVGIDNIRKCSDTSLEPTPEKYKVKKVKYMQKCQ